MKKTSTPRTQSKRAKAVQAATERSVQHLKGLQRQSGAWWLDVEMAPTVSALAHLVMVQLGYANDDDTRRFHNWVRPLQNEDGSFVDNFMGPGDDGGLRATAAVWGALKVSGVDNRDDVIRRAGAYIEANGGLDAIAQMPMGEDAFSVGPLLAYGNLIAPNTLALRHFPLVQTLVPFANDIMGKVVNVGFIYTEQLLAGLVTSLIEGGMHGVVRGWERAHVEKLALQFQNKNGSWNDTVNQTILSMAAFHAMGMAADAEPMKKAAKWVQSYQRGDDDTLHYLPIGSAVWDSALVIEALMCAGVDASDEAVEHGVEWLLDAQLTTPMPDIDQPRSGAPRTGGWAFEKDNETMPDCDDTGLVLGALGLFQQSAAVDNDDTKLVNDTRRCIRLATDWLEGMQHDDGGWGAYMSEQPRRQHGVLFERAIMDTKGIDWLNPKAVFDFVDETLQEAGDISTAGLTGRVVHGLCACGLTGDAPGVKAAVDFLLDQQLESGAWFGRWIVNQLAGTGWVLKALGGADVDKNDPHVVKAVAWLRSVQNKDGGFGESPKSYVDPDHAGQGPSMPGLTGLVVCGLQCVGYGDDVMVARAIDYLVKAQRKDGSWDNGGWQHVWFPPVYFYVLPSADQTYPLQALGRFAHDVDDDDQDMPLLLHRLYAAASAPQVDPRLSSGGWSTKALRQWRKRGDVDADHFIYEMFAKHERTAINDVFKQLVFNDDPMPPGIDPAIVAYFDKHASLPSWADDKKIQRAHDFYEREGWKIAFGLFCGALPQTYAAGNGARVLGQTQQLTQHTRRRILETAQFIFDVLEPGAFGPKGRGIRAAQKVRLLHTTIRHFTLREPSWDVKAWGIPINQEDMAGTMMAFSVIILDVIEGMGEPVDPDDAEAFVHLWTCVGHLIGVEDALMPKDRADGEALMQAIRDDQWQPSPYGKELAQQLTASMADYLVIPGGQQIAASLIRSVSGDKCANILGLPDDRLETMALRFLLDVVGMVSGRVRSHAKATLFDRLATRLMESLVDVQREGKQASFRLPATLLHDWGISSRS